jgi:hypothetical protein
MRKLVIAAGTAALLAASSISAFGAEATGAIQSIDPAAGTVTLADGKVYKLPAEFDAATLQVGQEVTITFEEGADGTATASSVKPKM